MSIPVKQTEFEFSDFRVEKNVEVCDCPAIWYDIFDKNDSQNHFRIYIPGLKIDEFSAVLVQLDELLCSKILPAYNQEITHRFFEEFLEQFYPEKKNEFVLKFSKFVCIIDNAQNNGESSADFALSSRQLSFLKKTGKIKTDKERKNRVQFLKDYK